MFFAYCALFMSPNDSMLSMLSARLDEMTWLLMSTESSGSTIQTANCLKRSQSMALLVVNCSYTLSEAPTPSLHISCGYAKLGLCAPSISIWLVVTASS